MISLIIKAQAVDYLTGAVLYASFEGNSLMIANQNTLTKDCDILIRGDAGVKARFGWTDEGYFFFSDVNFDDKLVEVITPDMQLCIDLEKDAKKVFKNIKDEIVIINFNDEIELYVTSNRELPETNNISPLGREVVTLTEQAREKIISIRTHRDLVQKKPSDAPKKRDTKHIEPPSNKIPEFEEFEIVHDDYKPKSDVKTYPPSRNDETAMTYGDVAWWASQTDGLNEEYVPNPDTKVEELDIDEDIDEIQDGHRKDGEYFREFDDEMQDSDKSLDEMTKYIFEFPKHLYLLKTSEVKLTIKSTYDESQRIKIIPRFPGCNVEPGKFIFDPDQCDEDEDDFLTADETFYVTPQKIGSCRNLFFEFWSDGEILWRKYLNLKNIRMPVFIKIILSLMLIILAGFTAFILYFENLISLNTFNISMVIAVLIALVYILASNRSSRFTEDAYMSLEDDTEDDE